MDKPHLFVTGFANAEQFGSKSNPRNPGLPERDRRQHGRELQRQYTRVLTMYEDRRGAAPEPITDELGIYLEIGGAEGFELPLDSLDTTRDFELRSVTVRDNREVAVVFVPETRRAAFARKVEAYLDPDRDSARETDEPKPRNRRLVQSIDYIRLANLRSFWTDEEERFPDDPTAKIWWEIWLKKIDGIDAVALANQFTERVGAQIGQTSLSFFDTSVVVSKASREQLELATELISNLSELRLAKAPPTAVMELTPIEQAPLAESLINRAVIDTDVVAPVLILDSGVNFDHPILSIACDPARAVSWDAAWPLYDKFDPDKAYRAIADHGSKQAGLAMFGDLTYVLIDDAEIRIPSLIESGRILPPSGENDPELYGAVTTRTARNIDRMFPDARRIYSLAVTAEPDAISGQPTSWSAEIDFFTSGMEDGVRRLFVISAGNILALNANTDYWEQVQLTEIEDPAQSWNAITVGAFTEKTQNDDPIFAGWEAWAAHGDISPTSRSSVNWGWEKHAPLKPDVVAEGGNRLISEDGTQVSDADTVRLLTTSGRSAGPIFETTGDTSAATALVSQYAAILSAEYPEMWPETVRGLIVHSAEWTDRMYERAGLLQKQHSPKRANRAMLSVFGHGVPDIERARYSANHALTLISESELRPFIKSQDATQSTDPKLNEMVLHSLPWPTEVLQQLEDTEVQLKVTLSYFIEPNPGRRGYRRRYSYQSHGLRFEVIRPGQELNNFRAYVNGIAVDETYTGPQGDAEGWRLGRQLRNQGSIHSDIWTGPAINLAKMNSVAVYPVGGWWKYRTGLNRWEHSTRYTLIASIETPDEATDIYTSVSTQIEQQVEIMV